MDLGAVLAGGSESIPGLVDPVAWPGWLGLAFLLGLVHAFDADHVMAVSLLSTRERGWREGMRAGLRWAVGHGGVLVGLGAFVVLLGLEIPSAWTLAAERCVGLVMIALGLWVARDLARRGAHVHFHRHDGLPPHAHWHDHAPSSDHPPADRQRHRHAASMVGALHGLAGSAPILALVPMTLRDPGAAIFGLVVFGLGVAGAMAVVSGLLGHVAERLGARAQSAALRSLRAGAALGSIAIGAWLVASAGT